MPLTRTVNLSKLNRGKTEDNLDPITYNDRYPWLDEYNYKKLESKVDNLWLTGYDREKAMDEAYVQVIPLVQNQIKNSDRRKYINQAKYEASQIEDPSARFQANAKLWVTELTQLIKEKYNVDPSYNDEEVFNSRIETIPNWEKLLVDYLNNGSRELLYAGWLEEKKTMPETPESSVWGIQSIINKQSDLWTDSTLGKINEVADWGNLVGKWTEWVDSWIQKIPVVDGKKQAENLLNKVNNLTKDEISELYGKYVEMVKNWSKEDDRWWWELLWDGINGDKQAVDRLNTLQLVDYSEAMPQDWVERNQWGNQIWDNTVWTDEESLNEMIDSSDMSKLSKNAAKAWVWTADKIKNLINFVGGSRWWLENVAEWTAVWLQKLDDIRDRRWYVPQDMETNENAFEAYIVDKTANFGEQMLDAPDMLLWRTMSPNVVKFVSNIPQSFLKTLSSKVRWKTNPLDSKIWLAKMLFTEEWQDAMVNRYWSVDAIANSMNTDPVWLASDMIDFADKLNLVLNKTTWWAVERQSMWDVTDILSDDAIKWISIWLWKTSDWLKNKWWNKSAWLVDIETDAALNPSKLPQDIAKEWGMVARDIVDTPKELSERYSKKSNDVWEKAKDLPTRKIPEKIVENDLKLTPKERANVEKNGITAANFILKEKIAGLDNEDKIVALQDISSDAYNNITNTFKNKIPDDYREKSTVAPKMLRTMIDAMETSDIVKEEYGDYINKLKEMSEYEDYSPYEKLAIRRDFDAIVWNDLFKKDGHLKGDIENGIIAWWRADLNDEINKIWKQYWIDVKDENSRISNAITIRDWLIRSVSQWKKNNLLWLQDLWIWAVLSAWNPVQAWGIMIAKKVWDAKSWKIAQSIYNLNSEPLKPANTKKWPWFIKKSNWNANSRFMISTDSNNTTSN